MRSKKIIYGIGVVMMVALAFVAFHAVLGIFGVGAVIYSTVGTVVPEALTTDAVNEAQEGLLLDDVSQKVVQMRPARTPLDTIMTKIRNATPMESLVTRFYGVETKTFKDTTDGAYVYNDTGHTDGEIAASIVVDTIAAWAVGDTAYFPAIAGSDSKGLTCRVLSKTISTRTLYLQPLNGSAGSGTTANKVIMPSIADGSVIVRMGKAMKELDMQTEPYGMIPEDFPQYAQTFMAQVEQSTYEKMHKKEVAWDFSDLDELNIYDMRAGKELAYLFGYGGKFLDVSDSKYFYTTHGIFRGITKKLEYGTGSGNTTIDNATLINWAKQIFVGNSGSDTRVLFMGGDLAEYMHAANSIQKQIDAKNTLVKFGLTFNTFESNFGRLMLYHHPLFDLCGWDKRGLVLDLENVEKRTFLSLRSTELDLKTSGQRDADAKVLKEASCLVLKYPDTHAWIDIKA